MARHLKGYEVLGALAVAGLALALQTNTDTNQPEFLQPSLQVPEPATQQIHKNPYFLPYDRQGRSAS